MEFLGIIVFSLVLIGAASFALLSERRRRIFKQCCKPTEARVTSVHAREYSTDSPWPDHILAVSYEVSGVAYRGQLTVGYWTLRSNFPELLGTEGRRGVRSVPIVVDPAHPRRIALDSRCIAPAENASATSDPSAVDRLESVA